MAPSIEVTSVPPIDENTPWQEKMPIVIDVAPDTNSQNAQSSSASPIRSNFGPHFELEDHPIDVIQNIRVS
jgi:hypothetical protein